MAIHLSFVEEELEVGLKGWHSILLTGAPRTPTLCSFDATLNGCCRALNKTATWTLESKGNDILYHSKSVSPGKTPWLTLLGLAVVNSIGFSGATIVAVWVIRLGPELGQPVWFGGLLASIQLAATVVGNAAAPLLYGRWKPVGMARFCLMIAFCCYLVAPSLPAYGLFAACLAGGMMLGIVLNCTNRIMAVSSHVHHGFSVFQVMEGLFSASFVLLATIVAAQTAITNIFFCNAVVCLLAAVLLPILPIDDLAAKEAPPTASDKTRSLSAWLGLSALALFLIGQNAVLSHAVAIAATSGLDATTATGTISFAMAVSLLAALSAGFVSKRIGMLIPICLATLALATLFAIWPAFPGAFAFQAVIVAMMSVTMFVVPCFFTMLALLDPSGRSASVAPAFLLGGVGLGLGLATILMTYWGASAIPPTASVVLLGSVVLVFALSRTLPRSSAR